MLGIGLETYCLPDSWNVRTGDHHEDPSSNVNSNDTSEPSEELQEHLRPVKFKHLGMVIKHWHMFKVFHMILMCSQVNI